MDIPSDLLDLQRAFFAADAECHRIAALFPPARELINGTSDMPRAELERLENELEEARARRLEIVLKKAEHPWLAVGLQERLKRDMALREAARETQHQ